MTTALVFAGLLICTVCDVMAVSRVEAEVKASVNPIRKVVTLLQKMQSEISAEGAKKEKNVRSVYVLLSKCRWNAGQIDFRCGDQNSSSRIFDRRRCSYEEATRSRTERRPGGTCGGQGCHCQGFGDSR